MELSSIYTEYQIKKGIKNKWKILMERTNNVDITKDVAKNKGVSDFNKKANYYVLEDIFIKHYGFDVIIVLPYGKSLNDFRKLLPAISVIYRGEVIAEYSSTKSSIYMRYHLEGLDISEMNDIKFKWYQMFSDSKQRNYNGETFSLGESEKIYHPTQIDKKNNKILIGYRFKVSIPNGLSYDLLEGSIVDLNKVFGICSLHFNDTGNQTTIEIMITKLPDKEKFEPIKVKPYELYCGMTHYYKPIILDFSISPNAIWGGQAGSGKTVSMIMSVLNLVLHNDEKSVQLFVTMLSSKQDLKVFKKIKQCKYYANTYQDALKELLFLSNEVTRRNKLFDNADEYGGIVNIYEYNDRFPSKKLPLIYFCIDEIASFSVNGTENDKNEKRMKELSSSIMWQINREGRSAGVYCLLATQRGSVANLSPEIKSNLGNQICFHFSNIPSAMTILGDGELATLAIRQKPQREFICVADQVYNGKTLYLTTEMMIKFLKPLININKEFMTLDNKGNIVQKNQEKLQEINENEQKTEEKDKKVIDFTKKPDKSEKRWSKFKKQRSE
jgi:S-DNA-T family DNA segregation ATPase FtsK/SpoIIIE